MTTIKALRRLSRWRWLVLGGAAGLALAIAAADRSPTGQPPALIADASASEVRIQLAAETKPAPPEAAPAPASPKVDAEISIGESGVVIRKGGRERVIAGDSEYDSFDEFVEKAPWIAGLVFLVAALVFIVPLLAIGLIVWYKMRNNRMRNETMLKLAERGVVPPGEAMAAMAGPAGGAALESMPSTAPLYEQAKRIRKREAWSDLRKGVILGGIGLGLTFWSMLEEGSANGFGLVLLFVGIGYVVLWYFEERQISAPRDTGGGRPPGGG